eukprot:TRINITY_DN2388_c0_g1_i20.p1 TRINITY_DN2388_c0_g1~~TRINITY_DN2388_c0_g1_i20.p1  ORF type:complete len:396 (+),score=74.58 TRINITY_DN2388_c0_g1_i20:131-1318(+)
MKSIILILMVVYGNAQTPLNGGSPSPFGMLANFLHSTGHQIKAHYDGFVHLINSLSDIYYKRKHRDEGKKEHEEHPRMEQFLQTIAEEDEETYAGNVAKGQRKQGDIYYIDQESNLATYTRRMEEKIYYPWSAYSCNNYGILHYTNVTAFRCNDCIVCKKEYDEKSLDPGNRCYTKLESGRMCSCSRDRYGPDCDEFVPIFCNHKWIKPTINELLCNKSASNYSNIEYYDDSRYGMPPCIFIGEAREYTFEVAVDCRIHRYGIEGFKNGIDYLPNPPDISKDNFNYWINVTNFAASNKFSLTTALTFLNFNHLSQVEQFTKELTTKEEITGEKTLKFAVDFSKLQHLRYGGRWYFELVTGTDSANVNVWSYVTRAVIDDALYKDCLLYTSDAADE